GLDECLMHLLPGRSILTPFDAFQHHDDRAALVCALTALCVAAVDYTVVGNHDGWIVLPPPSLIKPWAWEKLLENSSEGGLEWNSAKGFQNKRRRRNENRDCQ